MAQKKKKKSTKKNKSSARKVATVSSVAAAAAVSKKKPAKKTAKKTAKKAVKKATKKATKKITKKAAKKTVAKKAPSRKKAAPVLITPEERMRMIEQAAYFRAEKAGFSGDPHQHWVDAEAEVDALLGPKPAKKKTTRKKAAPKK